MKINIQPTQKRKRKGFTLVELLVVIAIIASLAGLSYGPILKHIETSARTEAISNGKSIYGALLGYMVQNGNSFPTGTSPEAAFNKLFKGGHVNEEKYFWNKQNARIGLANAETKPDEEIGEVNGIQVKTLDADENVWGYVKGVLPSDGHLPLIFDSSKTAGTFDVNVWKGKAIVLKADSSCLAYNIINNKVTVDPNYDPDDTEGTEPNDLFAFTAEETEAGVEALVTSN